MDNGKFLLLLKEKIKEYGLELFIYDGGSLARIIKKYGSREEPEEYIVGHILFKKEILHCDASVNHFGDIMEALVSVNPEFIFAVSIADSKASMIR